MLICKFGCNRQYKSLAAMMSHRDAFHVYAMMKCKYGHGCYKLFKDLEAMLAHKTAVHDNRSIGKTGSSSNLIASSSRQNSKVKCLYGCDRLFKDMDAMLAHKIAFHDSRSSGAYVSSNFKASKQKRQVSACNDCGKDFPSIDALRHHQMTKKDHVRLARAVGSFGCEACSRSLRSQDALEQHFVADHILIQMEDIDKNKAMLVAQFLDDWRKPSMPTRVLTIFKVYNPGWRVLGFERYKASLPDNGNVVLRYHGTSLLCDLGIGPKNSKLCQLEGCNLCSILKSGFKTAKAKTGWQRFGHGIYTTATSGKSNDYIQTESSRRAVLVCRVAAGKVYRTQRNMPTLDNPPPGYNSVSGEVGIHLNYDETVVYESKAILPAYMIVYSMR